MGQSPLLLGFLAGLAIYLGAIVLAVVEGLRYQRLRQLAPYILVAIYVALSSKHGVWDALGFFIVLSACTWAIIWSTRKQWRGTR
jgi:hypothetical protein